LSVASTKFAVRNLKFAPARIEPKVSARQINGKPECGRYFSEVVLVCEPVWLLWNFRTAGVQSGAQRSLKCQSSFRLGTAEYGEVVSTDR
jgi:hypothetical protein